MSKAQFALSDWRDGGVPNWLSWHLGASDLGTAPRSSSFVADTALPAGRYRVTSSNYTVTGYDRGHNGPSVDRARTSPDNNATFLMTDIMPQAPDNNQGPWADLEDDCRELVAGGNELDDIRGGDSPGRISGGMVNIPAYTREVILVLPRRTNDLARINDNTRVIAVDWPNEQGIRYDDCRTFRVSCRQHRVRHRLQFLHEPLDFAPRRPRIARRHPVIAAGSAGQVSTSSVAIPARVPAGVMPTA